MLEQYPEHAKVEKVKNASEAVGQFLDWLAEQHYTIAQYDPETFNIPYVDSEFIPVHATINTWLARYFHIDLDVLEQEKIQMLQSFHRATDDSEPLRT